MENPAITVTAQSISKSFGPAKVFEGISFSLGTGESIAVTGPNGSGKSTLCEIGAGIRRPTGGSIEYSLNGQPLSGDGLLSVIGIASPRINPYEALSGMENVEFAARSRGIDPSSALPLFESFGLNRHHGKALRHYSSGMRQRLKFILAVLHRPSLLILDEPGSNLDSEGRRQLAAYLDSLRARTAIIIATNDAEEARLCTGAVRLA
ncbi:MAG TPA: ABC transporter ATP-binding protein [Spirochaetota bacterium]|nr:ABC transporter ATP-binding protein [Spirochaetota bacterium]